MENRKFLRKLLEMIITRLARENLLAEIDSVSLFNALNFLEIDISRHHLSLDFDENLFMLFTPGESFYFEGSYEEITRKTNEFLDLAIDAIRNPNENK